MSDGCKESGRDNSNSNSNSKKKINKSNPDYFGIKISKIAVSQICASTGFHSAQRSALDTLADIAIRYICELGKTSHFYANVSGRTSCNEFDIIQGLEDLGSSYGFASASDAHHCLVGSGVVREVTQFVSLQEEIPFARSIPSFPVVRRSLSQAPSFVQIGEEPPEKYIPEWLPVFPEPHTYYVHTPVWNERATGAQADKIEQARQRRKAERSLLSLQKRLICSGTSGFVQAVDVIDEKGKQVVGNNPFLTPPLPAGEKDLPEIVIPNEVCEQKRDSILETFEPVMEAAKTGLLDYEIEERRGLPKRRPTVHFKFGVEKKYLALPLSSKAFSVKSETWFLRDDEKDDKKRRAEMILKDAMENPQELTQL